MAETTDDWAWLLTIEDETVVETFIGSEAEVGDRTLTLARERACRIYYQPAYGAWPDGEGDRIDVEDRVGIVVPPGHAEIHRAVTYLSLSELLETSLGSTCVAVSVIEDTRWTPGGLRMWRAIGEETGSAANDNDRALAVVRFLGLRIKPFTGPVLFVGAADRQGIAAGLHPEMRAWLDEALNGLYGGGLSWPGLPDMKQR